MVRGPVTPPHFSQGMLASSHWGRIGPVMFSICWLGTSHHRVSPGFCLMFSRTKVRGAMEQQLPYSSVATIYVNKTRFYWSIWNKFTGKKNPAKKSRKTFPYHLSSFPLLHIFKFRHLSNVTFSKELFLTPSLSLCPWRAFFILHCIAVIYLCSPLSLQTTSSTKDSKHCIF